jgi:AcrR family transcriptional regulator
MEKPIRKGVPKGEKRQRTRASLIKAAAELIGECGFEGATLERIAERAGMTRGAIYGNFESREALYMAVVESLWAPVIPEFEPGAPFRAQMRILGEAVWREAEARRGRAAGAAAFQLYLLTHPAMQARLSQANARIYASAAEGFTRLVPEGELPMPAERLVRVLDALVTGLMFTYFQTPELISREDVVAAFEALS